MGGGEGCGRQLSPDLGGGDGVGSEGDILSAGVSRPWGAFAGESGSDPVGSHLLNTLMETSLGRSHHPTCRAPLPLNVSPPVRRCLLLFEEEQGLPPNKKVYKVSFFLKTGLWLRNRQQAPSRYM